MLEIKDVSKTYTSASGSEAVKALQNFSFSLPAGKVLGVLGQNGAGKSTLLRILAGIMSADCGEVLINGRNISDDLHEHRRHVGYLSGSTGLFQRLTGEETLEFFAGLYRVDKKDYLRQREMLCDYLNMGDYLSRYTSQLSTGQLQKLNIARALIHSPRLLILDEATTGLDPVARHKFMALIRQIRSENTTIVYSTHHFEEVEQLCDQALLIDQGFLRTHITDENIAGAELRQQIEQGFSNLFQQESK